jgi:hypothetical protein
VLRHLPGWLPLPVKEWIAETHPFQHTALLITDDDGTHQLFQAIPEDVNGRWYLRGQLPSTRPSEEVANWDCEPVLSRPGSSPLRKSRVLGAFAADVNESRIEYEGKWGPNSNTYVHQALIRLGLGHVEPSKPAPGWHYPITIPEYSPGFTVV